MTMTKAQIEAWLAGWREAKAHKDGKPVPDPGQALQRAPVLSDFARSLAPPASPREDSEARE